MSKEEKNNDKVDESEADVDENEKDPQENDDYIIFSLDDDKVGKLGKILRTKYPRKFIRVAGDEPLNLKEIAKRITGEDNPRLSNTTHWRNLLDKIGLVKITLKLQRKKGHTLKYHKAKKIIIIVSDKELAEIARNSPELRDAIKSILKFGAIGIATIASFFLNPIDAPMTNHAAVDFGINSFTIPLMVLSIGMIIERITTQIRK